MRAGNGTSRRRRLGRAARATGLLALAAATTAMPALIMAPAGAAPAGTGATATTKAPNCTTLPAANGPGYNVAVGLKQDGKLVCAHLGEKLLVVLNAPTPTSALWGPIKATPAGILGRAPMTILLVRGATGAVFKAVKTGTVQLSSQRRACPPAKAGHATCMAIEVWRASILVRSS